MQEYGVEFNILCTVNAANSHRPLDVYGFFRDEFGARYVQFIPVVERTTGPANRKGRQVASRSVRGADFGPFLSEIFDEWVRRDVGLIFVRFFDAVLASYVYGESTLCQLRPTCGDALVRLKPKNGQAVFKKACQDPDPQVRAAALVALSP